MFGGPPASRSPRSRRRTVSGETLFAEGCGLKTTVFPAATMPMELQMIVEEGFVTGVIAPMTPNGAGSMRTRPWSPEAACGRELLGARRLVRDEEVLLDLVLDAPEARLLDGQRREGPRVLPHGLAHRLDDRVPLLEPSASRARNAARGRRDRVVEAREDAAAGDAPRAGPRPQAAATPRADAPPPSSRAISSARRRIWSGL